MRANGRQAATPRGRGRPTGSRRSGAHACIPQITAGGISSPRTFAQIVDRAIGKMNWSRDEVYRKLLDAFDRGFFGPDLHFADMKHSGVEGSEYELQTLTRQKLIDVLCSYEAGTVRDHYLAHCWVDIATANRWLEAEGVESPFVADRGKSHGLRGRKREKASPRTTQRTEGFCRMAPDGGSSKNVSLSTKFVAFCQTLHSNEQIFAILCDFQSYGGIRYQIITNKRRGDEYGISSSERHGPETRR